MVSLWFTRDGFRPTALPGTYQQPAKTMISDVRDLRFFSRRNGLCKTTIPSRPFQFWRVKRSIFTPPMWVHLRVQFLHDLSYSAG